MALLTPLSLADAQRLGARYGLSVASVRGIPAGSVNSNFELTLDGGDRVFLRVYEEQTALSAAGEARLLEHLAARGVTTPRPLALQREADPGTFIAEHAGKPVAVFPWVRGEALCQARVNPDAAYQVGAALGRVHAAGASFAFAPPSRFGVAQLVERIRGLQAMALSADLAEVVARLAGRLEAFEDRDPERAPGAGLVHGDLFRDNVLWEGSAITALLDFESASRESRPFDLMVTLLAWCFTDKLEPALARALALGYATSRPLPEDEAARLYDEGCFAALRFAITRITDFELRPRGSGVYKDYRRFLARGAALSDLGAAGLRTLLGL
jgi:homoserine kinase type II